MPILEEDVEPRKERKKRKNEENCVCGEGIVPNGMEHSGVHIYVHQNGDKDHLEYNGLIVLRAFKQGPFFLPSYFRNRNNIHYRAIRSNKQKG